EMAQVQKHEGQGFVSSGSAFYGRSQMLLHLDAIRQSCGWLVVRKPRSSVLGLPTLKICSEHFRNGVDQLAFLGEERSFERDRSFRNVHDFDGAAGTV